MENYINVSAAAKIIGVDPSTLRRWDNIGKFKSLRHPVNNYRVYTAEQINTLVEDIQLSLSYRKNDSKDLNDSIYFSTEYGTLYKGNSLEILRKIPSNSVDLIFADPPYNIKKAEWDTFASQKEYVDWSMNWIREAHRILTSRGSLFICGFSEILADLKWASSSLFKGCKWLVWFYRNKGNLGNDWGRSHESILHFRKSKDFIFNIDEVRIPYNAHTLKYPDRTQALTSQFAKGSRKNDYHWSPNPLGAKPKDVFEIPTIANGSWEKTSHLTQKPVELLRKIILSSSNQDSIVLDPFGGSGTTYAVAQAYNRRWIGIELDDEYCNIIKQRLNNADLMARINSGQDEIAAIKRRTKLRG